MNEPINVTPGGPPRDDEFSQRYYTERSEGPEWKGWEWAAKGRGFPWLGALLVLIGVALLINYLVPSISATTLVLLAIALAFLAGWLMGRSRLGMVAGILILSLGIAELIEDFAILGPAGADVPGLWSVALAVGFLAIWLIGYAARQRPAWLLWAAGIFGLIGAIQLSGRIIRLPALDLFWPIVIIALGILLLMSASRRAV